MGVNLFQYKTHDNLKIAENDSRDIIMCNLVMPATSVKSSKTRYKVGDFFLFCHYSHFLSVTLYPKRNTMARANIKQQLQQLDLFQVQAEYPKEIVQNSSQEINLDNLDVSKNVLICNVKKDDVRHFLDGTAKIYYTGKEFPSTIALNKLYYFIPFFGLKCGLGFTGIRDLYLKRKY